jgi:predicted nucleotidyltransferase
MRIPTEAKQAQLILEKHLSPLPVAVYLHGSAVAGGLHPHSDIDLLAVINHSLSAQARRGLTADLMQLSGRYPTVRFGRRPIELIVFHVADLKPLVYPARCELIFGEWLREAYERGEAAQPFCDAELTLVLAQARQQSVALTGPDLNELVPAVPDTDVRRAIKETLPVLISSLPGDERNVLLTLARMWFTVVTEGWTTKDAAANWAAARLPAEHAAVLLNARRTYLNRLAEQRQYDPQALLSTVNALRNAILAAL